MTRKSLAGLPKRQKVKASRLSATQQAEGQMAKLWSGRFREPTHRLMEAFSSSLAWDRRLYKHDIQGSVAHVKGLERAGVLSPLEAKAIISGLERIRSEFEQNRFVFAPGDEDIHMAIERRLTELIGPVGGKLHTGRSRNDQVTLDLRLYLREALDALLKAACRFQRALIQQARRHMDVAMPGYTHLQRAQPVLFAHHLLAYVEMVERDKGRIRDLLVRMDEMPLGSGALAGTNYPVDRRYVARLLGFRSLTQNSLDAVSDRDFVVETLAALALLIMHLSRLSEELILWSSQEFQFVELPEAFCTGSSMMPQKKNPDAVELIRGKTGRIYGHLMAVLTVLKGLPLSYNRDLQEDKAALFDALDEVSASLDIMTEVIQGLTVNREVMRKAAGAGHILATELADYLVGKGVPFREAHAITGRLVRWCLDHGKGLHDLTLDEMRRFSPKFEQDALATLTVDGAIDRRAQIGGTARKRVAARLRALEKVLV
jgi:argininosuccinate lyase